METLLATTGIACIIAAIVGGGLKAANVEFPLLASVKRQVLLGVVGFLFFSMGMATPETPQRPPEPEPGPAPGPTPDSVLPPADSAAPADPRPRPPVARDPAGRPRPRPVTPVVDATSRSNEYAGEYAGPGIDADVRGVRLVLRAEGDRLAGTMTFTAAAGPLRVVEAVSGQVGADGRLRLRGTGLQVEGGGGERADVPMGVHTYTLRRDGDGGLSGQLSSLEGAVYAVRLYRQ